MRNVKFRCSSLGKLMTEPKTKIEGPLSVTARSHIRELVSQEIFSVEFDVSDKKIEKGNLVEPDSTALLNRVRGLSLTKNTERRSNEWITGECDLFDVQRCRGHDLKSAWSVQTFPICPEDVEGSQRRHYDMQMKGYCWLWGAEEWEVNYCLVDTPEKLIGFEPIQLHVVRHIPERLRLTSWCVQRDRVFEQAVAEKVQAARVYYAQVVEEFERSHSDSASANWPFPSTGKLAQPAVAA